MVYFNTLFFNLRGKIFPRRLECCRSNCVFQKISSYNYNYDIFLWPTMNHSSSNECSLMIVGFIFCTKVPYFTEGRGGRVYDKVSFDLCFPSFPLSRLFCHISIRKVKTGLFYHKL